MYLGIKRLVWAGLVASMMATAHAADGIDGMRFGDWGGNCPEGQSCYIQQVLSQADAPLMISVIGYAPGKNEPTVIFELPPGIHIKAGVQLQVDAQAPIKFTGSCNKDYCRAGFALDDAAAQRLRKGKKASVSFTPTPKQQPTVLPLSLNGIAKALDALK